MTNKHTRSDCSFSLFCSSLHAPDDRSPSWGGGEKTKKKNTSIIRRAGLRRPLPADRQHYTRKRMFHPRHRKAAPQKPHEVTFVACISALSFKERSCVKLHALNSHWHEAWVTFFCGKMNISLSRLNLRADFVDVLPNYWLKLKPR